jgi:hypothetical protein
MALKTPWRTDHTSYRMRIGSMADEDSTELSKTCTQCGETKPLEAFRLADKRRHPGYRRTQCRQCQQQYNKAWKASHKEEVSVYNKAHRAEHKEERHAHDAIYRAANKEQRNAKRRENHARDKERINALSRANYQKHKEARRAADKIKRELRKEARNATMKEWRKANPHRLKAYNQAYSRNNRARIAHNQARRAARKRSLPDTFTYQEDQFCRQYFGYACAACGHEEGFQWIIAMDHWIPLDSSLCPGTVATNMIPLCNGVD